MLKSSVFGSYLFLFAFLCGRNGKNHKQAIHDGRANSGTENPYNHNKVVEIYRSGDYSCSNFGDDKRPCIVGEDIFHRLLFIISTILSYLWRILTAMHYDY